MARIYCKGSEIDYFYYKGQPYEAYYKGMLITDTDRTIYYPTTSPLYDNTIWNAYDSNILNESNIIYVIRHGARNSNEYGQYDHLNEHGILYSTNYIKNKSISLTNISFFSSNYLRTKETCAYIAKGIDDNIDVNNFISNNVQENLSLYGSWFTGNITNWNLIINYVIENYDYMKIRTDSLVQNLINMSNPGLNIMVTHDQLLVPFIMCASEQSIIFNSNNWLNFLAGIAIVIDYVNETYELVPIIGNDNTFQRS